MQEEIKFTVKNLNEKELQTSFSRYVLGIDIGGTNTNLGVAGIKNNLPTLLFSLNFQSENLPSLIPAVEETLAFALDNYHINIDNTVIGAAGVVSPSHDSASLTNVSWDIDSKDLVQKTPLSSAYIINDFQAIGYGINLLNPNNEEDLFVIRPDQLHQTSSRKAIIGAGTGFGKSILVYDEQFNVYVPLPSEGGHGDLPIYNDFEMELVNFIKKLRNISQPITYEEVLSGRGIESIYLFLRQSGKFNELQHTGEIDQSAHKTPLISQYRNIDETCRETFRLFTKFYGRCAKNFVLDSLAMDGLYIAGGIASKNKEIFKSKEFLDEFENAHQRSEILQKTPIFVIANYDVSLYGACFAAMYLTQMKTY